MTMQPGDRVADIWGCVHVVGKTTRHADAAFYSCACVDQFWVPVATARISTNAPSCLWCVVGKTHG